MVFLGCLARVSINVISRLRLGLLIYFICIGYSHVEFNLGGDPPIRVLVSLPLSRSVDPSSDSSDDDLDVEEQEGFDYRSHFIWTALGPAILKLGLDSKSRRKGAGNPAFTKWHIHPADWSMLASEVERLTTKAGLFGSYL